MSSSKSAATNLSSPEQVAETLLDGIKGGRFVPGQRLIEADLTTELGVSRGPVREALKHLAAEGLIHLIPHRGAYIRKLTRRQAMDILVIQETLTALAARLAAENIDADDNRARFQTAYDRVMAYRDRHGDHAELDERARFYESLVNISGNHELHRFVPIPQTNLLRSQLSQHFSPRDRARQFKNYARIAKHILSGNGSGAESVMQRHIRNSRVSIDRLDDAAFASESIAP